MKKRGVVQTLNVSPKGTFEGLLMKSGKEIVQVNFKPEFAAQMEALAGKEVTFEVQPEDPHRQACHPVFQLVDLGGNGHFKSKVKRLNYALHGEVNGAILESGDFLHVKPHGAAALGLKPGMAVEGSGSRKPTADGHSVIEATEVNGIKMEKKPKPKKKAHHS